VLMRLGLMTVLIQDEQGQLLNLTKQGQADK
jgi:hypothetical protein